MFSTIGLRISVELGAEISADIWRLFYQLYERTYIKRNGSRGYLTEEFFRPYCREHARTNCHGGGLAR